MVADRLVFAKVRARARGPSGSRSPAARRWPRRSPSSSTRSASGSSRATASPSARRRAARTAPMRTASGQSASRFPGSSSGSPRTARSSCAARPSSRATSRTPRRRRPFSTRRLAPHRRRRRDRRGRLPAITDRKKDILVTAGGKNVPPQNIENDLKTSQVRVPGTRGRRPQPVCGSAHHTRPGRIERWAAEQGIDGDVGALAARRTRARAAPGRSSTMPTRALAFRAGQALRDPPARLHDGGRRDHADAEAPAARGRSSTSQR